MWVQRTISLMVFIGICLLIQSVKDEFAREMFLGISSISLIYIWFCDALFRMSKYTWISNPISKSSHSIRFLGWIILIITFFTTIILKLT